MLSEKIKQPAGLGILSCSTQHACIGMGIDLCGAGRRNWDFFSIPIKARSWFSSTKNWLFFALLISVPLAFFQGGVLYSFAGKILQC